MESDKLCPPRFFQFFKVAWPNIFNKTAKVLVTYLSNGQNSYLYSLHFDITFWKIDSINTKNVIGGIERNF